MNALHLLLLAIFVAATLVQLVFWLWPAGKLAFYRGVAGPADAVTPPVSIVVCSRNGLTHLQRAVPIWLAQDYPEFELIVVDDGSVDGSVEWLRRVQAGSDRLRVLPIADKVVPGKKAALAKGIGAARHALVLLTDVDCLPASRQWIRHMQAPLRGSVEIGLGLGLLRAGKGFLNRFARYEALLTAMQYLGLAGIGMPYMGVGRNLIYTKALFERQGGFDRHRHLLSGDDDLFVNAAATSFNTAVITHPEAITLSEARHTWRGFFRQKTRHLSVGRAYKKQHKLVLGLLTGSLLGHYGAALALLLAGAGLPWVAMGYFLRQVVVLSISTRLWPAWKSAALLPWLPLLDLAYVLYLVRMAPAALWGKVREW